MQGKNQHIFQFPKHVKERTFSMSEHSSQVRYLR